jgi:hypothetical protein
VGDDYQCFEERDVKFDFGGQLAAKIKNFTEVTIS